MKIKSTFAKLMLLALSAGTMTYYAASLSKTAAAIQGKSAPNSMTSSTTFSNPAAITINDSASPPTTATLYPSNIVVAGLGTAINKVTVTLTNINHTFPDDIDVLLVAPGGQSVILMSDAGGTNSLSNVTLTFDDASPLFLNDSTQIVSGTYKPTNYAPLDTFPPPAPAAPYGATLSVFNGTAPNGLWKLYVVDDTNGDSGNILGGWSLTITEFVVTNNQKGRQDQSEFAISFAQFG